MYIRSFVLELHQKPKPILRKNVCFSLIFMLFFPALSKTIENFKIFSRTHQLDSPSHRTIDTLRENLSSLTAPNHDDRHKNKEKL